MRIIKAIWDFLSELIAMGLYHDPIDQKPQDLPMNQPSEVQPTQYLWNTPQVARHSVRVICDEEGLTTEQKNTMCATIGGESGWIPTAVGPPNFDDTRDWGICQINSKYWIGPGKQFPSTDYVLSNPEVCVRWMCKQWKLGYRNWWVAYKNSRYLKFM